MSNLIDLIRESKVNKQELAPATVRMPKELHSFIDGLAEHLSLSKQEMMLKLLQEGIAIAERELCLDKLESDDGVEFKFHVLNTNKRHDINDHDEMIKNGIAAAFYDPWKYNIDRIQKGDVVFLYENGVGIVAYGKGSGVSLKKNRYDDVDECHFQVLDLFKVLDKPLTAAEIKKILNRNVVFLRTMSGMPDGQKVLDRIEAL